MGASSLAGRWYDGQVYGAIVDRLLAGVNGYVASHLPDGRRVLDAGCGTGTLSQKIARTDRAVVGVDQSARHVEFARQRAARAGFRPDELRFDVGDLRELDPPGHGPYDVAVIVLGAARDAHRCPRPRPRAADHGGRPGHGSRLRRPLRWNLSGLKKRSAELAAERAHHAACRDYIERGGIDAIVRSAGVSPTSDRTIDGGTLRVVTVTAGPQ